MSAADKPYLRVSDKTAEALVIAITQLRDQHERLIRMPLREVLASEFVEANHTLKRLVEFEESRQLSGETKVVA